MKTQHLLIEQKLYKNPVFREFYEEVCKQNRIIAESRRMLLAEAELSAPEIDKIFRAVADGAMAGKNVDIGADDDPSSNKTMLGKGTAAVAGAANKIKEKFNSLTQYIQSSGPVQGFDVAFDQLQGSLLNAMGGDTGKVAGAMQKYRQFAVKHPYAQGFILVAIAALVGTAMGGGTVALAGVTFGVRFIDSLLKGHKFSDSTGKALKAAAVMAVAHGLMTHFAHADPVPAPAPHDVIPPGPHDVIPPGPVNPPPVMPDLPTSVVAAKGDTLSQIAQAHQTSVKALMQANPQITNPNALMPGTNIEIPPLNSTTYMGGVGTASNTAAGVASGKYEPMARALSRQRFEAKQTKNLAITEGWVDRKATLYAWALNESMGSRDRSSVQLTQSGIDKIFEQITIRSYLLEAEGEEPAKKPGLLSRMWGGVKSAAGAVGGAVKKGWETATNKITYDKLGMEWRALHPNRLAGGYDAMTADSTTVQKFLQSQGVKDGLIKSVFDSMGLPFNAPTGTGRMVDEPVDAVGTSAGAEHGTGVGTGRARGTGRRSAAADDGEEYMQDGPGTYRRSGGGVDATINTTAKGQGMDASGHATQGGKQKGGAGKVGDANDLLRDLEAGKAKKAGGATTAPATGGAQPSWANPQGPDYVGRREVARRQAAAGAAKPATPNYGQSFSGYGKTTYNMPTGITTPAANPADAARAKLKLKPAPAAKAPADDNEIYGRERVAAEARRVYGGRYVRESIDARLLKEFEFFVNKV